MTKHIDMETIAQLKELMAGDFQLLIDTFITDSQKRIQVIEKAINHSDSEALRTSAHGLKGSALNLSAAMLTELCFKLEVMGRDKILVGAEDILPELKAEYEAVKIALGSL